MLKKETRQKLDGSNLSNCYTLYLPHSRDMLLSEWDRRPKKPGADIQQDGGGGCEAPKHNNKELNINIKQQQVLEPKLVVPPKKENVVVFSAKKDINSAPVTLADMIKEEKNYFDTQPTANKNKPGNKTIEKALTDIGLLPGMVKQLFANYAVERIMQVMDYTTEYAKRKSVGNLPGLLVDALKYNWKIPKTVAQQKKERVAQQKNEIIKARRELEEDRKNAIDPGVVAAGFGV